MARPPVSHRPRVWIHRSPRFWWGLGILVFLLAVWITSAALFLRATHAHVTPPRQWREASFWLGNGGIGVEWNVWKIESGSFASISEWSTYSGRARDIGIAPSLVWKEQGGTRDFGIAAVKSSIFLPLWLPVLAWLGIWLLWMHRSDKKEEAFYETTTAPPPRE